jgi:hypothetical protein
LQRVEHRPRQHLADGLGVDIGADLAPPLARAHHPGQHGVEQDLVRAGLPRRDAAHGDVAQHGDRDGPRRGLHARDETADEGGHLVVERTALHGGGLDVRRHPAGGRERELHEELLLRLEMEVIGGAPDAGGDADVLDCRLVVAPLRPQHARRPHERPPGVDRTLLAQERAARRVGRCGHGAVDRHVDQPQDAAGRKT